MRIANINYYDTVNTVGGAVISVWTQGCPHHCEGCFNPETWDFSGGRIFTEEDMVGIIYEINENRDVIHGVSFLGGEPLCSENIKGVVDCIKRINTSFPEKTIMIWSGYTFKDIFPKLVDNHIENMVDYVVDGRFVMSKKDKKLKLRGSSNQNVNHNVNRSGEWVEEFK